MNEMSIYESGSFKREFPQEIVRKAESDKIRSKFPSRIPIILEQARATDFPLNDNMRRKFLVPGELTVGQFLYTVRKRLQLPSSVSVFLATQRDDKTIMHPTARLLAQVDAETRDPDGFLYMTYTGENTFG